MIHIGEETAYLFAAVMSATIIITGIAEIIAKRMYHKSKLKDKERPMELNETVDRMLSGDYKERFIAEYQQTKIRYEKLKDTFLKIEIAHMLGKDEPELTTPLCILEKQKKAMEEYLDTLKMRAIVDDIKL